MDPLAEMHLLLREAGWELKRDNSVPRFDCWVWSRAGKTFVTWLDKGRAAWSEGDSDDYSPSIDELRRRLKELAR